MMPGFGWAGLALLLGYLALFFWGSAIAAWSTGKPVWLFARAAGRDRLAAFRFQAAFALAFFGPLPWLAVPMLHKVDPFWTEGKALLLGGIGIFIAVLGAMVSHGALRSAHRHSCQISRSDIPVNTLLTSVYCCGVCTVRTIQVKLQHPEREPIMIRAYDLNGSRLKSVATDSAQPIWWDLFSPTREEEQSLEARLGLGLPTKDEMEEIEISSRLYSENGGHFMTALIPSHTDDDDAVIQPISFILVDHHLVTIRYTEPCSFNTFTKRAETTSIGLTSGETVLLGLLDAVVDRLADILELAGRDINKISKTVFGQKGVDARKNANYKATLEEIGRKGDLTSNIRDSLATLERLLAFLGPKLASGKKDEREQLEELVSDVRSLTDHAGFIEQKMTFLLDASLGLISIEQNAIIKIFSVAAVVFLPPTLVASVYGMNFEIIPELEWTLGYPFAIGLMILSAILPYLLFKNRGWL